MPQDAPARHAIMRFALPLPRAARKRTVVTGHKAGNAALLSNQLRMSTGATFTRDGVLRLPRNWGFAPRPARTSAPQDGGQYTLETLHVLAHLRSAALTSSVLPSARSVAAAVNAEACGSGGELAWFSHHLRVLHRAGFLELDDEDGVRAVAIDGAVLRQAAPAMPRARAA